MTENLPISFEGKGEVKGWSFSQKKSSNHGFVYEVKSETETHFETFKIKEASICLDFKKRIYSERDTKQL